ncbi:MAG: hypothetical protein ACK4PR_06110, partial [Gammaproteobacteria bacterium]
MRNRYSWILIVALILCSLILVIGWFGIPYYVGKRVKLAVIHTGADPGLIVQSSYWQQKITI